MKSFIGKRAITALFAMTCLAGCEAAKSANPTAPSVAGPIPGVNITAPRPLEPYAGSTLTFTGEAPTLLIENAGSSGSRTIWLQVEVATDTGFQQLVHQADQVSLGSDGRTAYKLPAPLGAGYTYYWRTRALDGANTGPYSTVSSFSVVPPVVIDAPIATAPSGKLTTNKPDFKVTNGNVSGTSGVGYRFEVSSNSGFSSLIAVVTVPINTAAGSTSMTLGELPYATTYFWRVRASDGSKESPYSNTMQFTTMDKPAPPPPTPTTPATPSVDASQWTTEQWRVYFFQLAAQKGGSTVSDGGMAAMRGDLVARGADFQNGWRGDMRPRIFLPVPGCPSAAVGANAPQCSYNRTVDLGNYGQAWQWIPRF